MMNARVYPFQRWTGTASILASFLAWFVVCTPCARAQSGDPESALQPNDFAYGMQLEPTPGHALQTFILPHDVLQHLSVRRNELSVFNQRGDRVPHAVRELRASGDERELDADVPFFPLFAADDAQPGRPSGVQVQVQRQADGRLVRVEVAEHAESTTPPTPRDVVAYLLDTTQLGPIERLRFQLTDHEPTFVWSVALETSRDLTHFSATPIRGSLLSLRHGEHQVELRHLTLSGLHADYLRLTWSTAHPPAAIEAVSAELVPERTAPPLDVRQVQGAPDPASPDDWLFDLGAALPVAKLELDMSESNTVIEAELQARPSPDVPFSTLHSGTFYRLEHAGTVVRSAPVELTPRHQRYVRVRVAPRGGGLGAGGLELRAHVIPEQLLFVARGDGPFQLAFGRFGGTDGAFDDTELVNLVGTAAGELPLSSAVAAPVVELGGAAALTPPAPATNYAKLVLWGVLGSAVLLLAGLSFMLFRRVNASGTSN